MLVQFDLSILKEAVRNGVKMANKIRATPLYLSVDDDTLSIKVFDADLMTQVYSYKIQQCGRKIALAFDVNVLSPLVNGAKAKLFTIDSFDETSGIVHATIDGVSYKIHSLDPSEYTEPFVRIPEDATSIVFTDGKLQNILRRLKPFLSKDEYRVSIQCVHLDISDGEMRFCATDSFRLATCVLPSQYKEELSINIPEVAVDVLMSLGDDIELHLIKHDKAVKKVVANSGNTIVEFFAITDPYPYYKSLLPTESVWKVQYDLHSITEKIESMNKAFNMYSPGSIQKEVERSAAKLILDVQQFETKLLSSGYSDDVIAETTIINEIETTKERICINPFQLISIVKAIKSNTVNNSVLMFKSSSNANLIFINSDSEPEWLYIDVLRRE